MSGTMIYAIERTTNPTSMVFFPNVGTSVYYTLLAITNVGFEGFLPTTYLGKWIACATITIGILSSRTPDGCGRIFHCVVSFNHRCADTAVDPLAVQPPVAHQEERDHLSR